MPKFLENKLKKEYGANSSIPYKVMNKIGAMKGNKETAKGKAMERKHKVNAGVRKNKMVRAVKKVFGGSNDSDE